MNEASPIYLVIGGTGSVGACLVRRLCSRGASVVFTSRSPVSIDGDETGKLTNFVADARDFGQIESSVQHTLTLYGRCDGVANCVGSLLLKPAHLTTEDEWRELIDLNLGSAFATVKYASKAMMSTGGAITLVSSCAAKVGLQNHEAIAACKAGVEGLVRSAASTYAKRGIRVNCVAPGLVASKMTRSIIGNDAQRAASEQMHPLGRLGTPEDIAGVIDWLLGDQAAWITGQSIGVDGGLSTSRVAARTAI